MSANAVSRVERIANLVRRGAALQRIRDACKPPPSEVWELNKLVTDATRTRRGLAVIARGTMLGFFESLVDGGQALYAVLRDLFPLEQQPWCFRGVAPERILAVATRAFNYFVPLITPCYCLADLLDQFHDCDDGWTETWEIPLRRALDDPIINDEIGRCLDRFPMLTVGVEAVGASVFDFEEFLSLDRGRLRKVPATTLVGLERKVEVLSASIQAFREDCVARALADRDNARRRARPGIATRRGNARQVHMSEASVKELVRLPPDDAQKAATAKASNRAPANGHAANGHPPARMTECATINTVDRTLSAQDKLDIVNALYRRFAPLLEALDPSTKENVRRMTDLLQKNDKSNNQKIRTIIIHEREKGHEPAARLMEELMQEAAAADLGPEEVIALLRDAINGRKPSARPTIYFLGAGVYRVGDGDAKAVSDRDDSLLQAFIGREVMNTKTLARRAGLKEDIIPSMIAKLRTKQNGRFEEAIRPASKEKCGYAATVVRIQADAAHG